MTPIAAPAANATVTMRSSRSLALPVTTARKESATTPIAAAKAISRARAIVPS
jgi:hypothetical protein